MAMYVFHVMFNGFNGGEVRMGFQIICVMVVIIKHGLFFASGVAILVCKLFVLNVRHVV